MTHAEALTGNHVPQLGTDCGGILQLIESFPDSRIGAAGKIDSTIHVYACLDCGGRVSIDVGPDGCTTLNSYRLATDRHRSK